MYETAMLDKRTQAAAYLDEATTTLDGAKILFEHRVPEVAFKA
jgi:hypothetical protein